MKGAGKKLGRQAMRRLHSQRERIKALLERGETKREVARVACVSEATLYRFLNLGKDFSGLAGGAFMGWRGDNFIFYI